MLLHGYNVNEVNWEHVVWGNPPGEPGRIPTAVAVTLEENAEILLLFGSSIGQERCGEWVSSGRWMAELLSVRFEQLKEFTILRALQSFSLKQINRKIKKTFKLIEEPDRPANTVGELQAAARIIHEQGIQKLICVSSKDHVSRIIRDALVVFEGDPLIVSHVSVRAAATLYTKEDGITPSARASVANVVVIEPRATVGPRAQRMFGIGNNPQALAEIDAVLKKYGK